MAVGRHLPKGRPLPVLRGEAMNIRASRVRCPSDLPQLAAVLKQWHMADEVEDRSEMRRVLREREERDRRLIARARAGTLRHITQ